MARAASFDPSDRLPWLNEPPKAPPPSRRSLIPLILLAAAAAGAAGAAGWTALQRAAAPEPAPAEIRSADTVRLPPPVAARPAQVEPAPPSASEREALNPAPAPPARVAAERPRPKARVRAAPPRPKARARKAAAVGNSKRSAARAPSVRRAGRAGAAAYDQRAWSSGVRGRIIQLGAFTTPAQANAQWNRVYYRYPLLRPLPPRVVRTNIRGRTYYRLQLGTFSHAHSELLCQRLRRIGEGCIVLGLNRRGRRA